ncbi:MAG: helix-turn-helix domain-containing protein [Candidatus Syntropharchaeia archaeon]
MLKHFTKDELEERYRKERDLRVKERLLAILLLYDGKNIYEVAEIIRRSGRRVKEWLKKWNREGYEGIMPETSKRGRRPKISSEEWDKILKEVEGEGMTLKEVTVYVNRRRGVEYAYKTVWTILRKN